MAKRKITVTVDEEVVEQAHALGVGPSLSAVVNEALTAHIDRLARRAALGELLDSWDDRLGPASAADAQAARAAFDELDGLTAGQGAA
jgi:post-segregation antitoxin (ccd killing protein)